MAFALFSWIAIVTNSLLLVNAQDRFVLVHGIGHGAWCWYKVAYELEQRGYKVDAVDLVSAGTSNVDVLQVNGVETYSLPLIQLLESFPATEKAILVGHSFGGLSVTYVMEKLSRKISKAVYVTALMLSSNATEARNVYNQLSSQGPPGSIIPIFRNDSSSKTPPAGSFNLTSVRQLLYNKSPSQDVVLAKSILKPFPLFDPAVKFTSAKYGSITRYFIKTSEDHTIPLALQEKMIEDVPPFQVFELNSDHSPFFSNPQVLVDLLLEIANN